jgi:peptidoglycan/xylan/chitin deacetylase (PgdA/CDA1 family)
VTSTTAPASLAILGYHHIGEPPEGQPRTRWYLPERIFEDQLSYLRGSGWNVIDADTFLRGLTRPAALPSKPILLTFDDCHRSLRRVALPRLQRFGYPAVAFAPTDFIGGYNTYDMRYAPQEPLCSWQDLGELQAAGVSIQSHSATHRGFSWLDASERERELLRSKQALEEILATRVEVFAFPYGDDKVDPAELEALFRRTGYRAACLFGGGANRLPIGDPYRLQRIAIESTSSLPLLLEEPRNHVTETGDARAR